MPRPPAARPQVRTAGRAPLAARVDVLDRPAVRTAVREEPGRLRRFVRRYGWRAYAVPFLTVATLLTLVDLAVNDPAPASSISTAPSVVQTPAPTPAPTPVAQASAPAAGDAGPTETAPVPAAGTYVELGAGSLSVVDGSSRVYGTGPLTRFIVEVEHGIDVDGAAFAEAVTLTLGDPRSWGAGGRMSFQRVGAAEAAAGEFDIRVALVSPGSMERYCPGVGTGGYTSCRYGDRAVINLARWATAVPHYDGDIATYRLYVVNHEVGHALGNGHRPCPGPGEVAPVMQQQTLRLDGCTKNAWPYP
ncbi:hypothetical protein GCM10010531_00690 [Blastococcus jejuensis]|uniref:DUF3152 domain-containing protein n=1 Tax=Blastococcus jejuensis TaxID=351224 RepID=A0ABP6NN00_9ACTN